MGVTIVDIRRNRVDIYAISKGSTRKAEMPVNIYAPQGGVDFAEALGQAMEGAVEHVGDTGLIAIDLSCGAAAHEMHNFYAALCAATAAAPGIWSEVGYLHYNGPDDSPITEEGDDRGKQLHDHYFRTLAEQDS